MRKKYSDVEKNLMLVMGNNLRKVLEITNNTQKDLADKSGLSTSAVSDYVNAKTLISPGNLQLIADTLSVKKSDIDPTLRSSLEYWVEQTKDSRGAEETMGLYRTAEENVVLLPIVGKISCGNGTIAFEEIEGYEPTPKEWLSSGEHFYLRAKGDSMTGARIFDGDLLLIRKQPEVENGEIAAVLIGEDAVLKRVYRNGEQLVLQSENPNYPPIFAPPTEVKILGKLKMNVIKY